MTDVKIESEEFFEGTEKLLEVWFTSKDPVCTNDLRQIEKEDIVKLLSVVQCEILSEQVTDDMTAYILSESSLFISKNRFILKTCGKTTLLEAIPPLLNLVNQYCKDFTVEVLYGCAREGLPAIPNWRNVKGPGYLTVNDFSGTQGIMHSEDYFYSRKKFERPDLQHKAYQRFDDEVQLLDSIFEDGAAYCLGRMNDDCWYLYTKDSNGVTDPDQTLEDLDDDVMSLFYKSENQTVEQSRQRCGVDQLFPGALIDDWLFEPCGYSANGVMEKGEYFTIHITPEKEFSYVSFETNAAQDSYHDLITKVLTMFKPGRFIMTLFANKNSVSQDMHKDLHDLDYFHGYRRRDHQLSQFMNYTLTYTHYVGSDVKR